MVCKFVWYPGGLLSHEPGDGFAIGGGDWWVGGGKRSWAFPFRTHVSHDGFATLHRDIDLPPAARRHQDGSLARLSIDLRTPQLEAKVSGALSAVLHYTVRGDPCPGPVPGCGLLSSYRPCCVVARATAAGRQLRYNGDNREGPGVSVRIATGNHAPLVPPRPRKRPACRGKRFHMSDSRRLRGW